MICKIRRRNKADRYSLFSWSILGITFLLCVATSATKYHKVFAEGEYSVRSDCPGSKTEGLLTISKAPGSTPDEIYSLVPGTEFGLPTNTLASSATQEKDTGEKISMSANGRECRVMIWEKEEDTGIFACYQDNDLICTIQLKKK